MALDYSLLGGISGTPDFYKTAQEGIAAGQKQVLMQQLSDQIKQAQIDEQKAQEQNMMLMQQALAGDVTAQSQLALKAAKNGQETQQAFAMLDKPKREERKNIAYRWDALARSNPDALMSEVDNRISALENSDPTPDNQREIAELKAAKLFPKEYLPILTMGMVAQYDPDNVEKYTKSVFEQQKLPSTLAESKAKATTAQTEAKYAESGQLADLALKRAQTEEKVLSNQVKRLEAQGVLTPEKQLELEEKRARIDQIRGSIATTQQKLVSDITGEIDNQKQSIQSSQEVINTANKLLTHPGFKSVFGASSYLPTIAGTEAADAEAVLEQLSSQSFMASVDKMRGLGALTEMEGKKLTSALSNVKPNMSEGAAKSALNDIVTIMTRGQMKAKEIIKKQEAKLQPYKEAETKSTISDLNSKY